LKTSTLIRKILLPVDFPTPSLSVIRQAVTLAERFHSEIVMLHVVTAESHTAGVPTNEREFANWDLLAEILRRSAQKFDQSLRIRLEALGIRSALIQGDPAHAILRVAQEENADLIMMPSHEHTFDQFLLGSMTAKVLRWKECPVWTGAYNEEPLVKEFSIRNILCAVDLDPRSRLAASWAAQLAVEFGAHLTLSHVTESLAILAPGGKWANPKFQQRLVDDAARRLTALRKDLGIEADLFVSTGAVPTALSQIANQGKADLLVLDCYPYSGNLRVHGYAIICSVPIPVLSV
jgi:nucleotide-binding universal stress UspA family protein